MLSACYEAITGRAPDMLRAYFLAVLVQLVVVNLLAEYGFLQATIIPLFGFLTALGGLVFGLGMTLAVGCVAAVFTRAGEGKLDYIIALAAYGVGAWASHNWLAQPLQSILGGEANALPLNRALGIDRWVVISAILVGALLWIIRGRRRPYQGGWDWMHTGILLGLVAAAAWIASSATGRPYGLGTLQGTDSLASFFLERDLSSLNWNLFVVVGIPLGSFVAAQLHGKSPGRSVHLERVPESIVGGLLMGLGATIAAGDNVAHGISGVPLLALSSLSFVVCMFLGVWAGIKLKWLQ